MLALVHLMCYMPALVGTTKEWRGIACSKQQRCQQDGQCSFPCSAALVPPNAAVPCGEEHDISDGRIRIVNHQHAFREYRVKTEIQI